MVDYSYYMGIIDYQQPYNLRKKVIQCYECMGARVALASVSVSSKCVSVDWMGVCLCRCGCIGWRHVVTSVCMCILFTVPSPCNVLSCSPVLPVLSCPVLQLETWYKVHIGRSPREEISCIPAEAYKNRCVCVCVSVCVLPSLFSAPTSEVQRKSAHVTQRSQMNMLCCVMFWVFLIRGMSTSSICCCLFVCVCVV